MSKIPQFRTLKKPFTKVGQDVVKATETVKARKPPRVPKPAPAKPEKLTKQARQQLANPWGVLDPAASPHQIIPKTLQGIEGVRITSGGLGDSIAEIPADATCLGQTEGREQMSSFTAISRNLKIADHEEKRKRGKAKVPAGEKYLACASVAFTLPLQITRIMYPSSDYHSSC